MGHALQRLGIHGVAPVGHGEEALPDGPGAIMRATPPHLWPAQDFADRPRSTPAGQHSSDIRTPETPGTEPYHAVHRPAFSRQHRSTGPGQAVRHANV